MRAALALAALMIVGCDRAPPQSAKGTADSQTPGALVSRLEELKRIAASGPSAPSEKERATLLDYVVTAFSNDMPEDLARRARRWLDENEHATIALERGLSHSDPVVRAGCANALVQQGSVASQPALLLRLRDEQNREVKLWLGAALLSQRNHSPMALQAVEQRFDEGDLAEDAGAVALDALKAAGLSLGDQPSWGDLRAAFDKLAEHWRRNGFALGSAPPDVSSIESLDARLRAILAGHLAALSGFQLRLVDESREVLRNLGVVPLPLLRLALTASETYIRAHAIEVVRDIGPGARPLEDLLLPLLEDPATRLVATEAAGRIGAATAVPRLMARLTGDDLDLAAAAAAALGDIGDESSRGSLQAIVRDEQAPIDLRVYSALGLARLDRSTGGGEGATFLRDLKTRGAYHEPTLDEMLTSLAQH